VFAFDLYTSVRWTSFLLGISLLLGCLEDLAGLREYKSDGLFSWDVLSTQFPEANSRALQPVLAVLFGYGGVRVLLCCQLAAVLVMLVPKLSLVYYLYSVAAALLIKLALVYRNAYGGDGSDQMEIMVLLGLLSTLSLMPSKAAPLGIWFIALQSELAYFASGVAKVFSRDWISGEAAFKIFNTYTYGTRPLAAILRNVPNVSAPLCWGLVAYECLFPASLFAPVHITLIILCLGVLLHMFNAFVMGLNKFFWAFIATYPAILYCNRQIAAWMATC
jgi:hypothetical protein